MPGRRRRTRPRATALGLGLALLLATVPGCGGHPQARPEPAPPRGSRSGATPSATASTTPAGDASPFWVDPRSDAARQVAAWEAAGRTGDAQVLRRIADRPMALWVPGDDPGPEIRRTAQAAHAAGRTLLLTAYNIPYRDCGQHSAGGAVDAGAYRGWIGAVADNIGRQKTMVVLEPDAVPHLVDGCTQAERRQERFQLLSEAVDRLKRNRETKVYIDAGNPAWVKDTGKLVDALYQAGLDRADGFSLNVSNFQSDADTRAYGAELSRAAKGKHFVIDTSRNGAGPLPGHGQEAWCNPPGRALGTPPTDATGDPLVDAYLWIKRPGESDGPCRGGPQAGRWWPDYALGLARRSKEE
ncbi:glycoside hydrolase family 6 protein [Streptomyces sp. NPDC091259]|uniref:glycoside hydrolase family 6 protein n=1 Tax=Streptomyces sp. NPDC091259 TaxID=3365976 RepID=UPI00382884B0